MNKEAAQEEKIAIIDGWLTEGIPEDHALYTKLREVYTEIFNQDVLDFMTTLFDGTQSIIDNSDQKITLRDATKIWVCEQLKCFE